MHGDETDEPVIGRLVERGLHNELKGTAYAIVKGIDGRTHHLVFADLELTGDARPGAIVETRSYDDAAGRKRLSLATRSDLTVAAQMSAEGEHVTGVYRQRVALSSGRFAMIDDGMGFRLVPWRPALEQQLGRQVSEVVSPGGTVDWSFGRKRGLGI